MLKIEHYDPVPPGRNALLFLGFRPFFLLAGVAAVLLVAFWIAIWRGLLPAPDYLSPVLWHGHEMIFGYAGAVIAGFLLTAVRNWTGIDTPTGLPLALLVLIWLVGRLLIGLDLGQPRWLTAAVDMLFLPALIAVLAGPLMRARKLRNIMFLVILAALAGANLLVHLEALGIGRHGEHGIRIALLLVVLVILILGGRVIPLFTRNPLPGMEPRVWPWLERTSLAIVAVLILAELVRLPASVTATLSLFAGALHLLRLGGWYDRRIWQHPVIWVLHVAYGWVAIGFLLKGMAGFGVLPAIAPTHAFTVGGIGLITLGMMGRVSLGHTGRPLILPANTGYAIRALVVAALLRVAAAAFPALPLPLIELSGVIWCLALAAFVIDYAPVLSRPRVDGRPG